jgi:aryl-alcohol dehydrogenase-like predicted oxidoreductase
MKYRRLGTSGLLVSEIALGTMVFGEESQRSTPRNDAIQIIHAFLDEGGNHIDTANVYGVGRSEEIVGQAIHDRRDQVILGTKIRFPMGDGPNDQGLSRIHIQKGLEASLKRLNTDVIDLLYMHCWDPFAPLEESLKTFDDLVSSGKVRYIGVSNFKAWQLMKALSLSEQNGWERFIAAQYQYSLVTRDIEDEFTDLFLSEGVGLVPWGPLGGGFLSGKYSPDKKPDDPSEGRLAVMGEETEEAWHRRNSTKNWHLLDVISKLAANYPGATHSQIAIAWLLQQPAVSSVIVGVRTMDQLRDNLGYSILHLKRSEIEELNQASQTERGYPYRFLELYGSR